MPRPSLVTRLEPTFTTSRFAPATAPLPAPLMAAPRSRPARVACSANRQWREQAAQAGCALDCAFCSTGKQGFNRNLSVAEIIGQLWLANRMLLANGTKAPWVEHGRHATTNRG